MKRALQFAVLLGTALFIYACGDDEAPQPIPTVDFTFEPAPAEVGIPVMFDNLSRNADSYEWDFGGVLTTDEISPTVTFENAGNITVTLRAFSQDGKVDSTSQTIKIHERVLTGFAINNFPEMNGSANWDPDTLATDTIYADVIIQFLPQDLDPPGLFQGVYIDVNGPFGDAVAALEPIVLTNEDWGFVLFDFDGEVGVDQPSADNTEIMVSVGFNPLETPTFKTDDGMSGFSSIIFLDANDNLVDIDLFFDLE